MQSQIIYYMRYIFEQKLNDFEIQVEVEAESSANDFSS